MSRVSLMIICFVISVLLGGASAQTFRVGVVLSQTGSARLTGQAQANAIGLLKNRLREGPLASTVDIIIRDDTSQPAIATELVRELIETEDVHALICCTTEAATQALDAYLQTSGILTLSLSDLPIEPSRWLFSVRPNTERTLQSAVLRQAAQGQRRFALMALGNSFGEAALSALERLLSPEAGVELVAQQRYRPDVSVLTPEALWTATRLPDTVFVWGLARDSRLAFGALRARGYEGDIILDPALLGPKRGGLDFFSLQDALFPVSPVTVATSLPQTFVTAPATGRYFRDMASIYGPERIPLEGAFAYDALNLLQAAFEQAFTYGVPLDDTATFRNALRDAFVSMGPVTGASAVFDYSDADRVGVMPESLVLAKVKGGKLEYRP